MDHFINLDRLPDGLEFPPDLKERIEFDSGVRKLIFHGYMSKTDFDRLSQLTNDWGFRRRLEELFRLCIPEEPVRCRGVGRFLGVFARMFTLG